MSVAQVQNLGLALFVSLVQASVSRPKFLGWGTGNGQVPADTDLDVPATEARVNGTTSVQNTSVTGDTYRVTGTLTANANKTITELGVFDAAGSGSPPAGGNMAFYSSFLPLGIETGDTITFTVDVVLENIP